MKNPHDATLKKRITFAFVFFVVALTVLAGRLFVLQIVQHRDYVQLAAKQHKLTEEIAYERGSIFATDKDGSLIPLAINRTQKDVIAAPKSIVDPQAAASAVAVALKIDRQEVLAKVSKDGDPYEVLARKVDANLTKPLEEQNIPGLSFDAERRRIYPRGTLASHVLGFVSIEDDVEEGKYGIEQFYEPTLAGQSGLFDGFKDAAGFWISLGRRIVHPPKNGSTLVLTIDYNIQQKAEEILAAVKIQWKAESGAVMVLDPKTGKILALASNPNFNPAAFSQVDSLRTFLNPLVQAVFEPGSVVKPLTMAAGIEEGLVGPQSVYHDNGEVRRSGYTIKNFDGLAHGDQTMTQVLEKSLNTGAVYVGDLLGQKRQREYLEKFGLGKKTGVDLSGEVAGSIANLSRGEAVNFATAAFGQGISVTPLQMAAAIGAIANGGILMRPYIVEKVLDDSGNEQVHKPQEVRQVITKETAETLTRMLVSVVHNGFDHRAGLNGYFVAGKTGTAQVPRPDGRGYSDQFTHTIVGYAPAFDPKFLVYIQLNKPIGNRFASNTLAVAFHDLTEYILHYYQIPPDEE